MKLLDTLLGRPLASWEDRAEKIGAPRGIPIFGLDALSSAAYGPEAAMTLLIPLGMAGVHFVLPITAAILALLTILYSSYRQTIAAYPNGGGSYTVAGENLGPVLGLLAGSALMVDYILEVAVGISAGVGALVSALPKLQPHTLALCLAILAILTLINLRGARSSGAAFMAPTYLFIICLLAVIAWGVAKVILSGGHPHPVVAPPQLGHATAVFSIWLLLKAFSSGCTAMTGVEAVSNGVGAFKEPHAEIGPAHPHHHHCSARSSSAGHRLPGAGLSHRRDRSLCSRLSKRALATDRGRQWTRRFLLCVHRFHSVGAGAFCQHRLRGFSTPLP